MELSVFSNTKKTKQNYEGNISYLILWHFTNGQSVKYLGVSDLGPCLRLKGILKKKKKVEGSVPHLNKTNILKPWWEKEVHTQLHAKFYGPS